MPKLFLCSRRFYLFLAVALLISSASCFAALGSDVNSVAADQAHMRAQRRVTQAAAYSLHEMQDENGITVREYVSAQGKVFGVAWQGPSRPDLSQVLGSYYEQFRANAPTRRVHGPITIQVQGFVLQSGGH